MIEVTTGLIESVAIPIVQTILGKGIEVPKHIHLKVQDLIFKASGRYRQNYINRHGILKVLGMQKPVLLTSVYTAAQFLSEEELPGFESIEVLDSNYRRSQQRSFHSQNSVRQDALSVAKEKQYLMVIGGPGAGKSTFLRWLGLEALKGKKGRFQHTCIPVFVELKEFQYQEINFEKKIAEEFQYRGFPKPDEFTSEALKQGKLLILLDGLDEVPSEKMNEVIRQIQNFVDLYDKNRFVVSCRLAAYHFNFIRFTDVVMADSDDEQIKTFIKRWFSYEPAIAEDCWQKLNSLEHAATKELAQTPLLLTLVCLLYQRARKFPVKRATLYEKALRVLLEEWAGEKGIVQDELYRGLDTRLKETMLAEIAHSALQTDQLFFSRRDVAHQIKKFLEEVLTEEKFIDGETVLKSIEVQHGVLVKQAENIYSFSHLTFQEYLTAQYIDDHRQVESLVTQHLTDTRWHEVFLLVAGLMRGGADELLLQMEKEAKKYVSIGKLPDLLHWAEQVTVNSATDAENTAKRAAAIFFSRILDLNHAPTPNFDLALTLAHSLGHEICLTITPDYFFELKLSDELTCQLEKVKIFKDLNLLTVRLAGLKSQAPDNKQSLNLYREFSKRLYSTWLYALKLNQGLVNLSRKEIKALEKYLYINRLMVQCKHTAVMVSCRTWKEIEERMLRSRE